MANQIIQRLSAENIFNLVPLYKAAFGINISLDYLRKKYDTARFGSAHLGYISFADGNIPTAFYGVIPGVARINGRRMLAAQSADTMTDPRYRRQGLFHMLARTTYDLARKEGVEFVYGFPNAASYPGFIKLAWTFLPEPLKLFKMSATSFKTISTRIGLSSPKNQHEIKKILRSSEIPVSRLFSSDTDSGIVHDENFFNYKTYNSTYHIDLGGCLCWVKVEQTLKVGLVVPSPNHNIRLFIRAIKNLAIELGCYQIIFITSKSSRLFQFLQTVLTPADAFPVGFYTLAARKIDYSSVDFEYGDIDSF
jgi:GNAT superfamily N-acetyltransferase